ncbi:E3 ubiquitin-protein ligase SHPRH-like [Gastrophryne carolinensis]
MASRRRKAPPVRLDDEAKKQLCWNMHENRRNDPTLDDVSSDLEASTSYSLVNGKPESQSATLESQSSSLEPWLEENKEYNTTLGQSSVNFSIFISPLPVEHKWRALVGIFSLHFYSCQDAQALFDGCNLTLTRTSPPSTQLLLCVHKSETEEEAVLPSDNGYAEKILVKASINDELMEDIMWLQKKKLIALSQSLSESNGMQVGIYLLETCLFKPEFLSEGHRRMKKSCIIIQRLMEKFYNFATPDIDDDDEESDQELERQNIEELYDYVRQTHQEERQTLLKDVQHPALIPVLRPYQNDAVNWMLQRENYKGLVSNENTLHSLWKEVNTLDGKKIYYNPFIGSIIREYPTATPEWPGGILADEMGLGKTVEVLSLILCHPRKNLQADLLMLPKGKKVSYFTPAPLVENSKNGKAGKSRPNFPNLRVMILSAIKELGIVKGVSIIAILKYVSSVYGYDMEGNRRHLKKTLEKLLSNKIVEQVKGRGLQGSFRLGLNYKEQMTRDKPQTLKSRSSIRLQPNTNHLRELNTDHSGTGTDIGILSNDHDYCAPSKDNQPENDLYNSVNSVNDGVAVPAQLLQNLTI